MKRPCLDCGQPTEDGSYCAAHRKPPYRGPFANPAGKDRESWGNALRRRKHPTKKKTTAQRGYGGEWQRVREYVLRRDRWECQIRGPLCIGKATTVDHILPISEHGPSYDPALLRAACLPCNSGRGNKAP